MRKSVYKTLWLLLILLFIFPVYGQNVDLLVSPGKLSDVHKHLSGINNCSKCHTKGKKTVAPKCLACHKEISERIAKGKGYHKDNGKTCLPCHPEHYGETFELIDWDPKNFDHLETGYPLTGLHEKVKECKKCHTSLNSVSRKFGVSYLINDGRCVACHKDTHKGTFGDSCGKCHTTKTSFKLVKPDFDHGVTRFPLKGKHSSLSCGKCHKEKNWKALKYFQCNNCHTDPHKSKFGKNCSSCHNSNSWRVTSFDHNRTRYPLKGKHRNLRCSKCHESTKKIKKIPFNNCTDCHKTDPHKGQFKNDCKTCHRESGFRRVRFDHDKSKYPLIGKHKKVKCSKCHFPLEKNGTVFYKISRTSCVDCHNDIHFGQFQNKCETCHTVSGFKGPNLKFEHNKDSTYLLFGKHAKTDCAKCHKVKNTRFPEGIGKGVLYRPMDKKCFSCHKDIHLGQLGNNCDKCHDNNSFKNLEKFSHDKSHFKLDLLHNKVECKKCHPKELRKVSGKKVNTTRYKPISTKCYDCHSKFDHDTTSFPLKGRHKSTDCKQCHNKKNPNVKRFNKMNSGIKKCVSCHKSPHPGVNGECSKCHNEETWRTDSWL